MLTKVVMVATLACFVLASTLAADAQQPAKVPRVGVLFTSTPEQTAHLVKALVDGLRDLGRIEGENVAFEYRFAAWKPERLPHLAAELVRLNVDVIVSGLGPPTLAAARATTTIPIVVPGALNPVETGLVASLARPGGNITGLSYEAGPEIAGKWLQLLKEVAPGARRVVILWNPGLPGMEPYFGEARRAASTLGLTLDDVKVREPGDLESAFAAIVKARADAVWVIPDPALVYPHRKRVLEFALKNRLPAFATAEGLAEAGALFSYAVSLTDLYRRAATYVDKILRGAKPADLPVEQPTRFELVINLKTAKTLGLTIPQSIFIRADHVIQ